MYKLIFIIVCILRFCDLLQLYHDGSKIILRPDKVADYFGYSVLMTSTKVIVGAPKAKSRKNESIATGLVFTCDLQQQHLENITCEPITIHKSQFGHYRFYIFDDSPDAFFKDDMWFGATIALAPNDKLMMCAPRWKTLHQAKVDHFLANGVCLVQNNQVGLSLGPLQELARQPYQSDGSRPEYGKEKDKRNLFYYAFAQAGMSLKVTRNNNFLLGAPGLLQWTGGIVDYKNFDNNLVLSKQPTMNPYYTKELGPDDYFGYSVDSGTFQVNASILYVAGAPRSKNNYGQVLIFDPPTLEHKALDIRVAILGPQLGSYFGASLCVMDINGDGRSDLLVGAPNFVNKHDDNPYDQGAVFVYLNKLNGTKFYLEQVGKLTGSRINGARFGTSISDLGDIDGDGFRDVAIGAPFEESKGAVYIYSGNENGIKDVIQQKLTSSGAEGFGMSIANADIDANQCNEILVGAFKSGTSYIYRCVPSIKIKAMIKIPNALDLAQNSTEFSVFFCVNAFHSNKWPNRKLYLKSKIVIDPHENRAFLNGDNNGDITLTPGNEECNEKIVNVKPTADLSRPLNIKFTVEQTTNFKDTSKIFDKAAVRLSNESELVSSLDIQLTRGCGADLICTPNLEMTLDYLENSSYVPGTDQKLGFKVSILNIAEPAFGAKVHLVIPVPLKRVPEACTLKKTNVTCNVPAPLFFNETVDWIFELEYILEGIEVVHVPVSAKLDYQFFDDINKQNNEKSLQLTITPQENITLSGHALPNSTVAITRANFNENGYALIQHHFEIINYGPSDWNSLEAVITLPNKSIPKPVTGCHHTNNSMVCTWRATAGVFLPIVLNIRINLIDFKEDFDTNNGVLNVTSQVHLLQFNKTVSVKTSLVLDPAPPIWPIIVGVTAGVLLLAVIVYGLYKYNFFSRNTMEKLKRMQDEQRDELLLSDEPLTSDNEEMNQDDHSTHKLVETDSD